MKNKSCCMKGFTLIELLVVVLIIGILAAVALPQYEKAVEKTRIAEAKIILNKVRQLHQLCVLEQGASACDEPYVDFVEYMRDDLPGEYESNVNNCATGSTACFKTKDWTYDTDTHIGFYANRNISGGYPYFLYMDYENGTIECINDNSSKDYCQMLCGSSSCTLK